MLVDAPQQYFDTPVSRQLARANAGNGKEKR